MGEDWSPAEEDDRANELSHFDIDAITLVKCLAKNEQYPTGEACLKLLKETPYVRLVGRAFLACWENQRVLPEN